MDHHIVALQISKDKALHGAENECRPLIGEVCTLGSTERLPRKRRSSSAPRMQRSQLHQYPCGSLPGTTIAPRAPMAMYGNSNPALQLYSSCRLESPEPWRWPSHWETTDTPKDQGLLTHPPEAHRNGNLLLQTGCSRSLNWRDSTLYSLTASNLRQAAEASQRWKEAENDPTKHAAEDKQILHCSSLRGPMNAPRTPSIEESPTSQADVWTSSSDDRWGLPTKAVPRYGWGGGPRCMPIPLVRSYTQEHGGKTEPDNPVGGIEPVTFLDELQPLDQPRVANGIVGFVEPTYAAVEAGQGLAGHGSTMANGCAHAVQREMYDMQLGRSGTSVRTRDPVWSPGYSSPLPQSPHVHRLPQWDPSHSKTQREPTKWFQRTHMEGCAMVSDAVCEESVPKGPQHPVPSPHRLQSPSSGIALVTVPGNGMPGTSASPAPPVGTHAAFSLHSDSASAGGRIKTPIFDHARAVGAAQSGGCPGREPKGTIPNRQVKRGTLFWWVPWSPIIVRWYRPRTSTRSRKPAPARAVSSGYFKPHGPCGRLVHCQGASRIVCGSSPGGWQGMLHQFRSSGDFWARGGPEIRRRNAKRMSGSS
eukprot:jgi/Botrbrau1/21733/Bobra.43_1s0127.1